MSKAEPRKGPRKPAKVASFKASVEVFLTKESEFLTSHGWVLSLTFDGKLWTEHYKKDQLCLPAAEAYRREKASIMQKLRDETIARWRKNITSYRQQLAEHGIDVNIELGPEGKQQTDVAIAASQAAKSTATWFQFLEANEIPLSETDQTRQQRRTHKALQRRD